jgi:hypothetical protein
MTRRIGFNPSHWGPDSVFVTQVTAPISSDTKTIRLKQSFDYSTRMTAPAVAHLPHSRAHRRGSTTSAASSSLTMLATSTTSG